MNRFLTFLLGAGLLLSFTNSEGHCYHFLNENFKKAFPEVTHLNGLLSDKAIESKPIPDTTNPGNKNKSTTAQDYNSTRSNKANSVIIINVGDSKPTNNKDSSFNGHPGSISTTQDFNTTRSNRQNSAIVINVGDNDPNVNDSTPQKHYAQDFNTTRSNRQNSAIVINVGNDNPNANDSAPQKHYAQDFNTTRSNRQNSAIVINVGNDNATVNDSTPQKHYAQDFNTTRSNRQNSAIVINVGDNDPNVNDSTPQKHYAQDFNTTRSNRQNSAIVINVGDNDPTVNDSTPQKHYAQDFNTTRSNRQNSNYNSKIVINIGDNSGNKNDNRTSKQEAQDYNSTRSNKVDSGDKNPLYNENGNAVENPMYGGLSNSGFTEKRYQVADNVTLIIRQRSQSNDSKQDKENPLYQGNNSEHVNPLHEGNAITGNGGDNPTNNPEKQPARQEAQDYNSSRSNKCSGHMLAGIANGNSDHTGSGWNIELGNRFSIINHLFVDISAGYASLNFEYEGSVFLSEEYVQNMKRSIQNNNWNMMTFSAGPALQLGSGRFNADVYVKPGITFIQSPDQFIGVPGSEGKVTDETGVAKFSGSATAFSIQTGININYAVSKKIDFFLNPNFFSTIGKNISYQEKDASKALLDDKSFDYKVFMTLPYETKYEQIRALGVSAGLRINLCR